MKDLTTQTGIIVKCSKTAIEFFQNAQSVDFFSALEIPKEFQDIAVEFYDLIMENDHLAALLGCRGNYDTNKMVDMFTSESSKEVTLLCENELMRVIIDHYGEDAAVDRYDDTHFTAKIEVNPSGTFYGWIFKFKGKIKILSPKECITEMQQIAQEFI